MSRNSHRSFVCTTMHAFCICGLLLAAAGWTTAQQVNQTRPIFHCGGDLVAESGFVGSEGFPSSYKANSRCTWRITVPEGKVVTLNFRLFDLEADSQCRYDYLDVYSDHSALGKKLGRFCGTFRPGNLISSSNAMMLEMVTDGETQSSGFVAFFKATQPYESQICGGKMTKSQGEIKTPNWPDGKYPLGVSCSWLVTVAPDEVIQVKFDKFVVEADSECRFDFVAFFNGKETDDSRLIGKFCGDQTPEPIVTSSNELLVQFVSDYSVPLDGFLASYTSLPRGSQPPAVGSGARSVPPEPVVKPVATVKPPIPTTTAPPPPTKPPRRNNPRTRGENQRVTPSRPNGNKPNPQNPVCPKICKRNGTVKTGFCSSEFVITGQVTSMGSGPKGSLFINISLIKAFKAGRLTITQAGEIMAVKLVSRCKKCPLFRRGSNYIIMGQVDEEGRGTLEPGAFTAPYKAPHEKLLMNISKQPC